jgi:hypothetical protein
MGKDWHRISETRHKHFLLGAGGSEKNLRLVKNKKRRCRGFLPGSAFVVSLLRTYYPSTVFRNSSMPICSTTRHRRSFLP